MAKTTPCKRAILRDGQVIGWEDYRPTSPGAAKIRDWGSSPVGRAARARYLESRLVPATSTQSTWEAEEVYGPYLYASWTVVRGYHWRLADIP